MDVVFINYIFTINVGIILNKWHFIACCYYKSVVKIDDDSFSVDQSIGKQELYTRTTSLGDNIKSVV